MTLLYNLILAAADLAGLQLIRATKSVLAAFGVAIATGGLGLILARVLGHNFFDTCRLAAWGLFLHGAVLSAGTAVVLWRSPGATGSASALPSADQASTGKASGTRQRRWAIIAAVVAAGILITACDALVIEPEWLEVSHVRIASPKLDRSWRIVLLADFQADSIGPYQRDVFRRIAEAKPDIVLLAGDYLQAPRDRLPRLSRSA